MNKYYMVVLVVLIIHTLTSIAWFTYVSTKPKRNKWDFVLGMWLVIQTIITVPAIVATLIHSKIF